MTDRVAAEKQKQKLCCSVFAACRSKGIEPCERYAIQMRVTSKVSMTAMDARDIRAVLRHLNGGGQGHRLRSDIGDGAHAGKLRALWISSYGSARSRIASTRR